MSSYYKQIDNKVIRVVKREDDWYFLVILVFVGSSDPLFEYYKFDGFEEVRKYIIKIGYIIK